MARHITTAVVLLGAVVFLQWSGRVEATGPPATGAQLSSEALEQEAHVLDAMLIAPCCFSQQVSVHKSPAADIRARLAVGETRQQILDAYVALYGKHVLAVPPAVGFDRTLYVLPFVMLLVSLGLISLTVYRFTGPSLTAPVRPRGQSTTEPRSERLETRLDDDLCDLD
jgi:cytochrome c-type biogenesis protein CcmH